MDRFSRFVFWVGMANKVDTFSGFINIFPILAHKVCNFISRWMMQCMYSVVDPWAMQGLGQQMPLQLCNLQSALCIQDSTSAKYRSCSTVVCIYWKKKSQYQWTLAVQGLCFSRVNCSPARDYKIPITDYSWPLKDTILELQGSTYTGIFFFQ